MVKKQEDVVSSTNLDQSAGAPLQATHGDPDHPLRIGDLEIPCYVLDTGQRVLVLGGMLRALDMSQGTAGRGAGNRLTKFISGKGLQPFIPDHLKAKVEYPLRFRTPAGALAYGYEATVLADICEAVIEANKTAKLSYQLDHIVRRAEILRAGFTRVGIIALVDEATGFQAYRAREDLAEILSKFISEELVKWAKTFPDEFYKHLFRLRGWQYSQFSSKRPSIAGKITNDIVYERIAPGVLEELKRVTPVDDKGRRKHKYFQRLTKDIGDPRLREHLASVITLMKASTSWRKFYSMLNRALPKYGSQLDLGIDVDDED